MTQTGATALLSRLADTYWQEWLAANPLFATSIGDRRYDHLLDDPTPEGRGRRRRELTETLAAANALAPDGLQPGDRITRSALIESATADLALLEAGVDDWTVDPLEGPQVMFNDVEAFQAVRSPTEGRAMVERWRAMGPWIDGRIDTVRRSVPDERVASIDAVERVIDELDDLLSRPIDTWALMKPASVEHDWSAADLDRFRFGLRDAVDGVVAPAFRRLRQVLAEEIRPAARPQERPGLMYVPGGEAAYRLLIRAHTSLEPTPAELHETGLREIERIDAEFVELGGRLLGTNGLSETLARLRDDDALYFSSRDEVVGAAESALARAREALDDWFGIQPQAPCEVVPMGPHEERHSTLAYYRQPAEDGSRPGQYFINTFEPRTRPRFEAEALAYHEAIPGHHLQIAIGQELDGLPAFRRHLGPTSYFEGWGLYTERLSDEMGLYSGDTDRFGILSFDAWRACRLVVDTGMHALGWSRAEAIDFMAAHSALSRNNIANEVDRYIVWPGQALAYKTGQLEILRLRSEAEAALDGRFDIRRFHDAVLGDGALPLSTLRSVVDAFIGSAV